MNVTMNVNGTKFVCSASQAKSLEVLLETNKGGFARVNKYVAKTGYVTPEVADITFLSRFSLERLYERKIAFLKALKVKDIEAAVAKDSKLSKLSKAELEAEFATRVAFEIASMEKTLAGVRDDARRQSHDRNYFKLGDGVKVHFLTGEDENGVVYPILNSENLPTVEKIHVAAIEISRKVVSEGVYKSVNSGVPVRISNAIYGLLPKATKYKTLALGDDNFESLSIDGNVVVPADIAGDFSYL